MLSTKEIITNYIAGAKLKVKDPVSRTLLLSILSGVFIAFAGVGYAFGTNLGGPFWGACVFPAGIIMVVVGGAKLFTGDCLLIIPTITRDVRIRDSVKSLVLVYLGNFIGSFIVVLLVVYSGALDSVKESVIAAAVRKSSIPFGEALLRGILCNILVCVAVWISFATTNVGGKIAAMFLPILVFVLAGFEHSVANMYFLPAGIFTALRYDMTTDLSLMASGLYANLIPVTLGNIIGGMLVGLTFLFSNRQIVRDGRNAKDNSVDDNITD